MMVYGLLIEGPFLHVSYTYWLPRWVKGNDNIAALKKMLICETFFTLYQAISYYFCIPLFEGGTVDDSIAELREKLWETLKMNWAFWPLLQFANFKWVPIKFQVLYVNLMSIFWNCYLSFMSFVRKPQGRLPPAPPSEENPFI